MKIKNIRILVIGARSIDGRVAAHMKRPALIFMVVDNLPGLPAGTQDQGSIFIGG